MDASEDLLVGTEVGTEIEPSQPVASKPLSVATIFGPKRCNEVNADYYCTFLAVAEATGPQRQKQEQQGIPLCTPVAQYGKAAVMALSNGGTAPRFSKYVGAVEWRNCVYLWVNVGGAHSSEYEYPNTFSEQGRHMMWFGGSRMHAGRYSM